MHQINPMRFAIGMMALSAATAAAQQAPLPDAMQRVMTVAKAAGVAGEIALADQNGAVADQSLGLADREAHRPVREPGAF